MNPTPIYALTRTRGGTGVFATQHEEHDEVVDEVEGELPEGLRGTFYRMVCGRYESGGEPVQQVFDGDGMVAMFVLDDGQVRFRSRYVRTPHHLAGQGDGGVPGRLVGTNRRGGRLGNALRFPANVANTSVALHRGRLYALYEFGRPFRLDPDTLHTFGEDDLDGRLRRMGAFSAHYKVDPATGELWNFGMEMMPRPTVRCYRLDPSGQLHTVRHLRIPQMVANHDFALTERHMVFALDPAVVSVGGALRFLLLGERLADTVRWEPERGTRIVLVPRDGGRPRVVETEAFFHFHVNNAYEDGRDVVLDLVRWSHGWDALLPHFDRFRTTDGGDVTSSLTRLRVTPSGRVEREELCELPCEFPQHDWRRTTTAHRYSYFVTGNDPHVSGLVNALTRAHVVAKVDHHTGEVTRHELPLGQVVSEAVFVPRSEKSDEDDGWLLTVAYDPAEHRSRLLVLDARDPQRPPLFTAHLRHHIPFGFHGRFTPRVAA